ncbi:MAG TPA: SUMF1/EgtB/PvdO family nonheme iron enzyme [Polyangiaceae bacterium]
MQVRKLASFWVLSMLGGCELVAGLDGERQLAQARAEAGQGGGGRGAGGSGRGGSDPGAGRDPEAAGAGNGALDAGAAGEAGAAVGGKSAGGAGASGASAGASGAGGDAGDGGKDGGRGGEGGRSEDGGQGGAAAESGDSGVSGASGGGVVVDQNGVDGSELDTPSCSGGLGLCAGANPCLTISVPGGSFDMGRSETQGAGDYFPTGSPSEIPAHLVTVSPYRLDRYEVTVGRFRRFVEAYDGTPPGDNAGPHPNVPDSGWQAEWNDRLPPNRTALLEQLDIDDVLRTWTTSPGAFECRPINNVGWYVAFAFCVWDGGRLPSEVEWEFAAAGGDEERLFPWGSEEPDRTRAAYGCTAFGGPTCEMNDLPEVGSTRPAGLGRFGHSDLAGSLWEVTRDQWAEGWYGFPQSRGTDPMNLAFDVDAQNVTSRGGGFLVSGAALRGVTREQHRRLTQSRYAGLRCARDP